MCAPPQGMRPVHKNLMSLVWGCPGGNEITDPPKFYTGVVVPRMQALAGGGCISIIDAGATPHCCLPQDKMRPKAAHPVQMHAILIC